LFDYLSDQQFIGLVNRLLGYMVDDGTLVIGNLESYNIKCEVRGGANIHHEKEFLGYESLDSLKHYVELMSLQGTIIFVFCFLTQFGV